MLKVRIFFGSDHIGHVLLTYVQVMCVHVYVCVCVCACLNVCVCVCTGLGACVYVLSYCLVVTLQTSSCCWW